MRTWTVILAAGLVSIAVGMGVVLLSTNQVAQPGPAAVQSDLDPIRVDAVETVPEPTPPPRPVVAPPVEEVAAARPDPVGPTTEAIRRIPTAPPVPAAEPAVFTEPIPAPPATATVPGEPTAPHDPDQDSAPRAAADPPEIELPATPAPTVATVSGPTAERPPERHIIREVRGNDVREVVYLKINGTWVRQGFDEPPAPVAGLPRTPSDSAVLTDSAFTADVLESSLPVVLNFTADWCVPCKLLVPVLSELRTRHAGKLKIIDVDYDTHTALVKRYTIDSVPTLLVFRDGELLHRIVGAADPEGLTRTVAAVVRGR